MKRIANVARIAGIANISQLCNSPMQILMHIMLFNFKYWSRKYVTTAVLVHEYKKRLN